MMVSGKFDYSKILVLPQEKNGDRTAYSIVHHGMANVHCPFVDQRISMTVSVNRMHIQWVYICLHYAVWRCRNGRHMRKISLNSIR